MNKLICDHTGEKYLSEVMADIPLVTGKVNLIMAKCGAGKTQYAIDSLANRYNKVLFLTDTTNNKTKLERSKGKKEVAYKFDGITIDEDMIDLYSELDIKYDEYLQEHPDADFEELMLNCGYISGQCCEMPVYKEVEYYKIKNITVLTYHGCGERLLALDSGDKNVKINFDEFDLIICDEPHNLIRYSTWSKNKGDYIRCKTEIINRVKAGVMTVGITATPNDFMKQFNNDLINPINLLNRKDVRHYHTINRIGFRSMDHLIKKLPVEEKKIVIYADKISVMRNIKKKLEDELGLWYDDLKIAVIFSINSEQEMDELSLRVRESIIVNSVIPDDVQIVIMNASCETGLDIKSHVDIMIAFTTNPDTQIQVRGRCRSDLMEFYYRERDVIDIEIPEEYLNKKLDSKAKEELLHLLDEKDLHNRSIGWRGLRKLLDNAGRYQITDTRSKNGRYSVIRQRDDWDILID